MKLFDEIFRLIVKNSLDGIKEISKKFRPEQFTRVLNISSNGATPLYLAIKNKRPEIASYLFELLKRQGSEAMCKSWSDSRHPLSIAILVGDNELTEQIARNLTDINDYIQGLFTPLTLAIYSRNAYYVNLFIQLGANVNTSSFCGVSPLMLSVSFTPICDSLLKNNAKLDHQDQEGNNALHVSVAGKYLQSLIALTNAGADVRIKNKDGITPLHLASVHKNHMAILHLEKNSAYTPNEKIEALEILSACYVCGQQPVIRYWLQALALRVGPFAKTIGPAQDFLDNSVEFTTEDEIKRLLGKPLRLSFQGILVIERILGKNNYLYLDCLLKTSLIAKNVNELDKLRQLMFRIKEYCLTKPAKIIAACCQSFKNLFAKIADGSEMEFIQNGGLDIFKTIARATLDMWLYHKHRMVNSPYAHNSRYAELVDTFLYLTSTILRMDLPDYYINSTKKLVQDLVQEKPYSITWQTLLHRAIKLSGKESWVSVKLIRVLLETGADVTAEDYFRRNPMIYAIKYAPDEIFQKIAVLLRAYGSPDCKGQSLRPVSTSSNVQVSQTQRWQTDINFDDQFACGSVLPEVLEEMSNLHL